MLSGLGKKKSLCLLAHCWSLCFSQWTVVIWLRVLWMFVNIYTEITNMFCYRVLLWFSFDLRFTADTTWSVLSRVDVVPPVHHTVPAVSSGARTQMSYRKNWTPRCRKLTTAAQWQYPHTAASSSEKLNDKWYHTQQYPTCNLMACILENIYIMRCKEIGCAVAAGLNNGISRERHTQGWLSLLCSRGLDSRWASPLAQMYLCCQVCLDDYPPCCAALWQLPQWESSSSHKTKARKEWQPITHSLVRMFPPQSLMDNITLSIDSCLLAVIIPYYPSLSICFDSDWKDNADVYICIHKTW